MIVQRMVRAPLPAATRERLRRDCSTTQAVVEAAARAGRTLHPRDAYKEFRAAQDYFELGCWLVYYRQQMANEEGGEVRCECAELLRRHGLLEPTRNFETVFGFDIDCYSFVVEGRTREASSAVSAWQAEVRAC